MKQLCAGFIRKFRIIKTRRSVHVVRGRAALPMTEHYRYHQHTCHSKCCGIVRRGRVLLFFLFTITCLTVRRHFHQDYIHLHNHVQPWPLISEHPEYTWHKDYSAAVELPVSSRSFAPAHCFCSWLSVWGETFQVCRPIFVRLHFFKKRSSEKFFTSPGVVVFADIVRLFKEPAGLAINITCWLLHAGLLALCAGYCFVFSPGGAGTLFADHNGLTWTVSSPLWCPFTPFVPCLSVW